MFRMKLHTGGIMKLITSLFLIIFSYFSMASKDADTNFNNVNQDMRHLDRTISSDSKTSSKDKTLDHLTKYFSKNTQRYKSVLVVKKFWKNSEPFFALKLKLFKEQESSQNLVHVTETLIIDPKQRRTSGLLEKDLSYENLSLDDFQKITYSFESFGDNTTVSFTYQ